MPWGMHHRRSNHATGMGSDLARSIADAIAADLSHRLTPLATADRNRVLLAVAASVASQLEALETDTTA